MKTDSFIIKLDGLPEPLENPRKLGYKGFNKNLQCHGDFQFEIGQTYTKDSPKKNPKTCSADGFHYCLKLKDVFNHFPVGSGNRFCVVEVLGEFTDEADKSTTTSIKILEEIPQRDIIEHQYAEMLNLPTIKKIQKHNPFVHLGGSAGLFLHGIKLQRIIDNSGQPCDIDVVSPFYHFLTGDEKDKIVQSDKKNSGNDFHEGFYFNDIGVDMRIDNTQKYDIITYKGFPYKVSKLEVIMAAKLKYAINGQAKHKDDCAEIMRVRDMNDKARDKDGKAPIIADIDDDLDLPW